MLSMCFLIMVGIFFQDTFDVGLARKWNELLFSCDIFPIINELCLERLGYSQMNLGPALMFVRV